MQILIGAQAAARRRVRRPVLFVALALLCGAAPGRAAAVIGGQQIEVQSAPWAVFIEIAAPSGHFLCSGSILDPTHVLTAAHCLFDSHGRRALAAEITVEAGVSDWQAPAPTDFEQRRDVRAFRLHPGYHWSPQTSADDVAVLELASPLELGLPTVQAIALPPPGASFPAGRSAELAGFGREQATAPASGALEQLKTTTDAQGLCGQRRASGLLPNDAVTLCAEQPGVATCNGDSGAGLVLAGAHPLLIGVVSAGSPSCSSGSVTLYTFLGAGEIRSFLAGSAHPPRAPRETARTFVDLSWKVPLGIGTVLHCRSGRWSGGAQLGYTFVASDGRVLARGTGTLVLTPAMRGLTIDCEVAATNAGGTTLEQTSPTPPLPSAPGVTLLALKPLSAGAGSQLHVRIEFRAPAGLSGTFGACLTPPAVLGSGSCSSRRAEHGGGTFSFVVTLRLSTAARVGVARIDVLAFAGPSSVHGSLVLHIRRR